MLRIDQVKAKLTRPGGTIGQLEALAGIEGDEASRRAFWCRQHAVVKRATGLPFPDPSLVFERAKNTCYRLVAARVKAGELSLI